jgi:spore coat-associated protein N
MTRIMSTRAKLLASTALLAAAAGAAGLGTFGSFTSTTSASQAVTSGTVAIALGTPNTTGNRLTVAAGNLVPGDTIQRTATLTNGGNQALAAVVLSTVATPANTLLTTDATNGLQMLVEKCTTAWVEAGTAPKYTYTCTGTKTTVLASQRVIGANLPLAGLSSLAAGGVDNLMVTLTFPTLADNTFQNLSTSVNFTFDATQRVGSSQ